jgi:MinD-like ATPase involved in chromosome partitioning or flagellar assembly
VTDNSDFLARYLPPDDDDRLDHLNRTPVEDGLSTGQAAETGKSELKHPASPNWGAPGPTSGHSTLGSAATSHAKSEGPPSAPEADLESLGEGWPPAAQQPPVPHGPSPITPFRHPQPPSVRPSVGEAGSSPLPDEWSPRVEPAARWAPQPGPRTGVSARQHIQLSEVTKQRREPAEMGWRKVVYVSTGHAVNLGAGPAELRLRDWKARIVANIPGNYQITAISVKGGVGKTRVTAGVGSVFAELRKQPVIAIDANPTYGGLGRLIDPTTRTSVRDFLAAEDLVDYPRARFYTGQNKQGLEVLAGNQNVANPLAFEARTFTGTVSRTRRFYQLALIDCGAEIEHPVIPAVLSASDALMIVGSCSVEGGLAVETTIDWLAARNGQDLLKRSVLVLNDSYRSANRNFISHVNDTLGRRVGAVKTIPWDSHLRDAVTLDFPALQRRTQLAFLELAAQLAGGFPTAGALAG